MKYAALILVFISILSCASAPEPIVINKIPQNCMDENMSIDEYIKESTKYAVELKAYTEELINQIVHKTRYIDLRENK